VVAEAVSRIAGFAAAGPSSDDLPVRNPSCPRCMSRRSCTAPVWGKPSSTGWWPGGRVRCAGRGPPALAFYRRRGFQPDGAGRTVTEWEGLGTIRLVR